MKFCYLRLSHSSLKVSDLITGFFALSVLFTLLDTSNRNECSSPESSLKRGNNLSLRQASGKLDSEVRLSRGASKKTVERDANKNPRWLEDDIFRGCPVLHLSDHETQFWRDLIEKYLFPLDANKEDESRVSRELKDLRDKVMFGVLMLNGIFILTIFLLQLNRDRLSITLPFRFDLVEVDSESILNFNVSHPFKVIDPLNDDEPSNNKLEPVGASFILFFALIFILQVVGMIKHRISTFSHILAFVKLDFFGKPKETFSHDDFIERNAVEIAKDLQCLRGLSGQLASN